MTSDMIQIQLVSFNIIQVALAQLLFVSNNNLISHFQFKEIIIISNQMDSIKLLISLLKINVLCLDLVQYTDVIVNLEAFIIKMIFG